MSKQTEALKLALEALENAEDQLAKPYSTGARYAITAIREALAEQPAQQQELAEASVEPVAFVALQAWTCGAYWPDDCFFDSAGEGLTPLYTFPQPSKPWVGLTDEEIKRMAAPWFLSMYWKLCVSFGRAIETKLKEKNT